MRQVPLLPLLLFGAITPIARASPPRVHVVASVEGQIPDTRAVSARLGQQVSLDAVVQIGRRYYAAVPVLKIRGRRVPQRRVRSLAELDGLGRFSWYRVEPRPHHTTTEPPNPGNEAYSNSILFGRQHGKWLGYDVIEYTESVIRGADKPTLSLTRVMPTHAKVNVHGGLGTMRYRAVVELGGKRYASLGAPSAPVKRGISPAVMRVSFRSADDFVGFLTSYYNVPNVFGSGGYGKRHQAELYQGADCADVITAAARGAGAATLPYTSAAGLKRYARATTERLLLTREGFFTLERRKVVARRRPEGRAPRVGHDIAEGYGPPAERREVIGKLVKGKPARLRFGTDVRRGDLMLIDYVGFTDSPRGWDHVAVVAADSNRAGWLDPEDRVMHMGYLYGLTNSAAHTEGPAVVRFLRFKPHIQRAFLRHQRRLSRRRLVVERR